MATIGRVPKYPQACLDEASRHLIAEVMRSQPVAPGVPAKERVRECASGRRQPVRGVRAAPGPDTWPTRSNTSLPPKHGNLLNVAGIELGLLAGPYLDRRSPDRETLEREVTARFATSNAIVPILSWRFATDDAGIEPHHLHRLFRN